MLREKTLFFSENYWLSKILNFPQQTFRSKYKFLYTLHCTCCNFSAKPERSCLFLLYIYFTTFNYCSTRNQAAHQCGTRGRDCTYDYFFPPCVFPIRFLLIELRATSKARHEPAPQTNTSRMMSLRCSNALAGITQKPQPQRKHQIMHGARRVPFGPEFPFRKRDLHAPHKKSRLYSRCSRCGITLSWV